MANQESQDGDRERDNVCSLCGSKEVHVDVLFCEDGTTFRSVFDNGASLRSLCDLHSAKLERWWKREQKKSRKRRGVNESSKEDQTVECENCGQQRYTFEACQHCDHVHWK